MMIIKSVASSGHACAKDVSLEALAAKTTNYSGAEITVRMARAPSH